MENLYEIILRMNKSGLSGMVATVVERRGSTPAVVGAKMLILSSGKPSGTVGGGALEDRVIRDARTFMRKGESGLKKYDLGKGGVENAEKLEMLCGGEVTVFFEYIGAPARVLIFGCGHVGSALVYHLGALGFDVTLIDEREDMLAEAAAGGPVNPVPVRSYKDMEGDLAVPDGSVVVVTTHTHEHDYEVLHFLCTSPARPAYIGVVASKRKAAALLARLADEKRDADLSSVYMPVGLDIGGRSPHEIALSIISEIQGVRYGKSGLPHLGKVKT